MNEISNFKSAHSRPVMFLYYIIAICVFVSYLYIYQYTPFASPLNDIVLNAITAFAALLVAVIATAIFLHYHPDDFPRKIWLYLMSGCWAWFLAEALWGILSFFSATGEVPTPSLADAGWVIGFIFFTIAFYHQYAILFPALKKRIVAIAIGAWALAVFAPLIVLLAMRVFTLEAYVNYYYPIADLAVGIAGIALVFAFRGGALTRPWFGLVVFGISDFFYAWADQTGLYAWSSTNNNALTIAIDSSYLAAYLILGMGFIGHWILINYGLRSKQ